MLEGVSLLTINNYG